jgi:DeoR/GlpR family transcriptional regulator of sugar metabolism
LLLSHGKTSVEELTSLFAMSAASLRRDLVRLEERGLVHRTHGGARLAGQALGMTKGEGCSSIGVGC